MTQERKDQLYDEMLGWICEHINNDEDLYITLHKHFGMTKEELHENCIESLDAFFPKYPISEKRAMLIEKIDEELALPENATNAGKLAELTRDREEKEDALSIAMEQWEELAEQLSE